MNADRLLIELIDERCSANGSPSVMVAKVGTVNKEKGVCDLVDDQGEALFFDVRLNAVVGDEKEALFIYPATDSYVLVAIIESDKTEGVIISYTKIEAVSLKIGNTTLSADKDGFIFNEGSQGMVKIGELTDKLNALIDSFNTHVHTASTFTGTISGQPATGTLTVPQINTKAAKLNKNDFEDTLIKHA